MKVYGNENLLKFKILMEAKQEKFIHELDALNREYTPRFAMIKKKRSNRLYIMGCIISLLVIVSFIEIFQPIANAYILYSLYGSLLTLLLISFILVYKTSKQYNRIKSDWKNEHSSIVNYKVEANEYLEKIKEEVYRVICLTINHDEIEKNKISLSTQDFEKYYQKLLDSTKQKIYEEKGITSAKDLLQYYEIWGERISSNILDDSSDFLAIRRKKAFLYSKDKDD